VSRLAMDELSIAAPEKPTTDTKDFICNLPEQSKAGLRIDGYQIDQEGDDF
jgi:hypothetical protein